MGGLLVNSSQAKIWLQRFLILSMLLAITSPIFFDIYRELAFNTTPHDDYSVYLLYLMGKEGGALPGAPTGYRLLSVVPAIVFYHLLPVYRFTYLPEASQSFLKAQAALALVSYISILTTAWIIYRIAQERMNASKRSALAVSGVAMLLFGLTSAIGVDPIAILFIATLVYLQENSLPFAVLLFISPAVNEKIPLLLALLTLSRLAVHRDRRHLTSTLLALASVGVYLVMRALIGLPGHDEQWNIARFLPNAIETLKLTVSIKGVYLNIIPILILAGLYALSASTVARRQGDRYFYRSDILVLVGMILIGFMTRLEFTVGRVVMFTFPLYLPRVACALDNWAASQG
jgi:hypothetical protein